MSWSRAAIGRWRTSSAHASSSPMAARCIRYPLCTGVRHPQLSRKFSKSEAQLRAINRYRIAVEFQGNKHLVQARRGADHRMQFVDFVKLAFAGVGVGGLEISPGVNFAQTEVQRHIAEIDGSEKLSAKGATG